MAQAKSDIASTSWKTLYKFGGAAAFIVGVLTIGEIIGFIFYPQPGTIHDWFLLFQSNKIVGLLNFWGLEILMYVMFIVVFLALYVALRKANESLMAIAITFVLVGAGVFFATNNPFSMLSLSNQYAAATTDTQKTMILAAGQAVLTNTNQRAVGGFNLALFLVSTAGLQVSWVMFHSTIFNRATACVGILAFSLSLADYVRQALTSSVTITLLVILPGAIFLVTWFTLVGWKLYQFGNREL